jgi:hypothetical protein
MHERPSRDTRSSVDDYVNPLAPAGLVGALGGGQPTFARLVNVMVLKLVVFAILALRVNLLPPGCGGRRLTRVWSSLLSIRPAACCLGDGDDHSVWRKPKAGTAGPRLLCA